MHGLLEYGLHRFLLDKEKLFQICGIIFLFGKGNLQEKRIIVCRLSRFIETGMLFFFFFFPDC